MKKTNTGRWKLRAGGTSLAESLRAYACSTRNLPLAHVAGAAARGDLVAMGRIREALEQIDTSSIRRP